MFRGLIRSRRMLRMGLNRKSAQPEMPTNTTKRKRFTGSYADLMKLPTGGTDAIQVTSGALAWMMDYDALP